MRRGLSGAVAMVVCRACPARWNTALFPLPEVGARQGADARRTGMPEAAGKDRSCLLRYGRAAFRLPSLEKSAFLSRADTLIFLPETLAGSIRRRCFSGRRRRSAAAFFALFRAEGRRHFRRGPERPWNIRPFPAADQLRNPSGRGLALHPLAGRKETKARCAFPWETGEPGRERASSSPAERARRRRSAAFLPWWRSWPCTSGRPWPRPEPRECGPPSSSARRSGP